MELRLLFEKEIRDLLGPKEAYETVRDAFVRLAKGQAVLPGVINLDIPATRTEAHIKGAYLPGTRHFAVKVASGSYDNPARGLPSGGGMFLVFDATTGLPVAVLFDNGYLTDVRTGAAGAPAAGPPARKAVAPGGGVRGGDRYYDDGGRQQAAQRGQAAAQDLVHRSTRFATAQGSPARGVDKEGTGELHRNN